MADEDIFYHYCSNDSFHSIVNNKTIRLSSLSLSNDKTEGRLVSRIFEAWAKDDPVKVDGFSAYIKKVEARYHAVGFCLSEEGDLLSQWRGYADGASGVSIGFSKKYLERLAGQDDTMHGQFLKIEYDFDRQKELMRPLYEEMKSPAARGGMDVPIGCGSAVEINRRLDAFIELGALNVGLAPEFYRLKDKAFFEEQEWRMVICLDEVDLTGYGCEYRMRGDQLVPYKDFPLDTSAIQEVVLGPKNMSSESIVKSFLKSKGFGGVVRKSEIPFQ
jgi:hypothetical protein